MPSFLGHAGVCSGHTWVQCRVAREEGLMENGPSELNTVGAWREMGWR